MSSKIKLLNIWLIVGLSMGTIGQDMTMANYKKHENSMHLNSMNWIKKMGIGLLLNTLMKGVEGATTFDSGVTGPSNIIYKDPSTITGNGAYTTPFTYTGFFYDDINKICFYSSGASDPSTRALSNDRFFRIKYKTKSCNQNECLNGSTAPTSDYFSCSTPILTLSSTNSLAVLEDNIVYKDGSTVTGDGQYLTPFSYTGFFYDTINNRCFFSDAAATSKYIPSTQRYYNFTCVMDP